jgi:NAD(P)-dependent dehydrogenase (short-subunit alcohol dehydrogenase family)
MRWIIDYLFPRSFSVDDIPDLAGKVVVVTGGCSGIGYEVASQCASHNARRIIIVSPPSPALNEAVRSVSKKLTNALGRLSSQFPPLIR